MRLPFVSRALHDERVQGLLEDRRTIQADFRVLTDDYRALLDKYHSLRSAGATPTGGGLQPEMPPAKPSDIAIEQVVERFGGNLRLRRKLGQFQADCRARDVDEDEIAEQITNWRDPAEDEDT